MKTKNEATKKYLLNDRAPSLVREVLSDLLIRRWFLTLLVLMAVTSAMLQAKTSHEVRRAVAESQKLREERQKKEINWQALRLEMTSLSEANRILSLAKKELDMIEVNTKSEKIITL